jgi:hypothetical protein
METIKRAIRRWLGIPHGEFVPADVLPEIDERIQALESKLDKLLTGLDKQIAKSSVFDRDKIPPSEPQRYVPIAKRRALAERQSMGPQTHRDEVRANNARAMETI